MAAPTDAFSWTQAIPWALTLISMSIAAFAVLQQRREKSRVIRVAAKYGFLVFGDELGEYCLIITISNPGFRNVMVQAPQIIMPGGGRLFFKRPQGEVEFPYELPEGRSCTIWQPVNHLVAELKLDGLKGMLKLVPVCSDATGKEYRGKAIRIDLDQDQKDGKEEHQQA